MLLRSPLPLKNVREVSSTWRKEAPPDTEPPPVPSEVRRTQIPAPPGQLLSSFCTSTRQLSDASTVPEILIEATPLLLS